jgi:hypothetical protein
LHDVSIHCFSPSVSLCRTNFAQTFLFHKSLWRICWIISLLIFNSSDIIMRAHQWSHITILWTFSIMCALWEAEGHQLLGSSRRSSRLSLSHLNHSNTLLWLKDSSLQTVCKIS